MWGKKMEKSRMIRGTSKSARFFLHWYNGISKRSTKITEIRSNCSNIIWEVTYCNCNDGSRLEKEKDVLTVRFNGDGAYGILLATAKSDGSVKGYIEIQKRRLV